MCFTVILHSLEHIKKSSVTLENLPIKIQIPIKTEKVLSCIQHNTSSLQSIIKYYKYVN